MDKHMKFKKVDAKRKIEEILGDMNNIINASSDVYQGRVVQFINRIENSDLLLVLFQPYFDMKVGEEYGFHNDVQNRWIEYKLPIDDDEEIAVVLQFLRDNSVGNNVKENHLNRIAATMYCHKSYNDNLNALNNNIIYPTFKKIEKKLEYKLEDLALLETNEIDQNSFTIISIGNVSNSNLAIGNNINQNIAKIDDIIVEVNNIKGVDDEVIKKLLDILSDINNKNIDKRSAFEKLLDLIVKYIQYYRILAPVFLNIFESISNFL